MEIVLHRRNSIQELISTPRNFGVEVDVRIHNGELVCAHDPFLPGDSFKSWLSNYNHGLLVVNVKEEGLEPKILELLSNSRVINYFFLDQSFPYLLKTINSGNGNVALRVSEYESSKTALSLALRANWLWVDTFSKFPLTQAEILELRQLGFKFCVVSPELHGRKSDIELDELLQSLQSLNFVPDAICTKFPEFWKVLN